CFLFFFQAEDGIRAFHVTGVQTCALPIWSRYPFSGPGSRPSRASARRREGLDCHDPDTTRRAQRTRTRPVLHAPAILRHLRSRRSEERRVGKESRSPWAHTWWQRRDRTTR